MKFKKFLLLFYPLIFLSNAGCKKDKIKPSTVLPPTTQEGKNTMGCKVNDEVWVPFYECPAFRENCSELSVSAGNTLSNGFFRLSINAGRKIDNTDTHLLIETYPNETISSTGNKSDSVEVHFYGDNNKIYGEHYYPGRVKRFEVTKFDTTNKIVSGIFDFTLYKSSTDSIKITEGRFDLMFFLCKCSK